jgi:hypothetical protein
VLAACFHADPLRVHEVARLAQVSLGRTSVLLRELRDDGMVDWVDGQHGTLRLTCRPSTFLERSFDILTGDIGGPGAAETARDLTDTYRGGVSNGRE